MRIRKPVTVAATSLLVLGIAAMTLPAAAQASTSECGDYQVTLTSGTPTGETDEGDPAVFPNQTVVRVLPDGNLSTTIGRFSGEIEEDGAWDFSEANGANLFGKLELQDGTWETRVFGGGGDPSFSAEGTYTLEKVGGCASEPFPTSAAS